MDCEIEFLQCMLAVVPGRKKSDVGLFAERVKINPVVDSCRSCHTISISVRRFWKIDSQLTHRLGSLPLPWPPFRRCLLDFVDR